jgi:hypothetical protein
MAAVMHAQAIPNAVHFDSSDVVVIVKRAEDRTLRAARGRKTVWDIVDAWPQPIGNDWNEAQAKEWLRGEMERIKPDAVIAATARMAEDLKEFDVPVLWLKHHHRPHIRRNSIHEQVRRIGYEGCPRYVERWKASILRECDRVGAEFAINPETLADCDIVVALRDARGYPARYWKSGVKLANAHASGTPFVGCRESGYMEIATGCEYWADTQRELGVALDWLISQSAREQVSERFLRNAYSVDHAASDLRKFLQQQFG